MKTSIDIQPQLILIQYKPDGNGIFVDFLIVIDSLYTETRFKSVNNNLGKDQRNSGLDLAASYMQGKSMGHLEIACTQIGTILIGWALIDTCVMPFWSLKHLKFKDKFFKIIEVAA